MDDPLQDLDYLVSESSRLDLQSTATIAVAGHHAIVHALEDRIARALAESDDEIESALEELVSNNSQLWFIDIFTPMLGENGQPRRELFGSDMLHMNAAGYELWQSIFEPFLAAWAMPIDLNGDGIVDAADMCIMVDHWGENYSLCDIGPTPLGDGIVDVEDLTVLAEHLFEEVPPAQ